MGGKSIFRGGKWRLQSRTGKLKVLVCFLIFGIILSPNILNAQQSTTVHEIEGDVLFKKGKTVSLSDEKFRIGIFPKALDIDVNIELKEVGVHAEMIEGLPENKHIISPVYIYDILAQNKSNIIKPFRFKQAAITLEYDADQEYLNKGIYYWDRIKQEWIPLTSDKRRLTNTMSAWVHVPFAQVAVLADKPQEVIYNEMSFNTSKQLPFYSDIEGYVLINETDKTIEAAQNIFDQYPIASLTKLMTSLVLEEEGLNMNEVLTYNSRKHYAYRNYLRLKNGDQITVRDLYYSMLIGSLNVPSRMLAKNTQYTEKQFIYRMNGKAKELGLKNTNFDDTSGLSAYNESTVFDLYKLFNEAYENSRIREGLIMAEYDFDEVYSIDKKENHNFKNTNHLIHEEDSGIEVLASKTGYTQEALSCLAMRFKKHGKEYTLITIGNPDYKNRFNDILTIVGTINSAIAQN